MALPYEVDVENVSEATKHTFPGDLDVRFVMEGRELTLALATGAPGEGETWHKHAEELEEIYYTLAGKGRIQWKEEGDVEEVVVEEGDAILLPKGIENDIEAVGSEPWTFIAVLNTFSESDFDDEPFIGRSTNIPDE